MLVVGTTPPKIRPTRNVTEKDREPALASVLCCAEALAYFHEETKVLRNLDATEWLGTPTGLFTGLRKGEGWRGWSSV